MVTASNVLPGMTAVRGLAAFAIFCHHCNQVLSLDYTIGPFNTILFSDNCRMAVALFVLLSGYLLSLPYWRALEQQTPLPATGHFFLRRGVRILPAYWLLLFTLAIDQATYTHPEGRLDLFLHVTFLFNFFEFSHMSLNPVLWTLAAEVQLYILLPFLFYFLNRFSRKQTLLLPLFLSLIATYILHCILDNIVVRSVPLPNYPYLLWLRPHGAVVQQSTLALAPHFFGGVLLARLIISRKENLFSNLISRAPSLFFWGSTISLLLLLASPLADVLAPAHSNYGFPLVLALLALLLLSVSYGGGKSLLEFPPLRWLGIISYSFYLFHYPCLQWFDNFLLQNQINAPDRPFLFILFSFSLSVLMATLSFFIAEKSGRKIYGKFCLKV